MMHLSPETVYDSVHLDTAVANTGVSGPFLGTVAETPITEVAGANRCGSDWTRSPSPRDVEVASEVGKSN